MGGKARHLLVTAASMLLPLAIAPAVGDTRYEAPKGIVDCLLPGSIRRVGGSIYQMPGRPIRTIASECEIRGGDYLLFDRANYETSLSHWVQQAEMNDVDAMLYVGEIYEKGLGRDPDFVAAASWYQKAADAGNATAKISLAHLYKTGQGVELDLARAQALYSEAFGADIPIPLDPTSVKGADQRIQTLIAEVDDVRRQKIAVEIELQEANDQLASARAALDDALAGDGGNANAIRDLQKALNSQQIEIKEYQARIAAMQAHSDELRTLRQQLADEQLETANLKQRLQAAETEVELGRSQLSEQRQALQQKETEFRALLANLQTEQDRDRLKASSDELDTQRRRVDELEAALHEAEEQKALYQALASDVASNEDRVATLTARISILEQQSLSRESEFDGLQRELADTRAELDAQFTAAAAADQASDAEISKRNTEIERLRAVVARAEQETGRHQGDIERLAAQSTELETLRGNLEREQAQSNRLQQLLTESQDQFVATNRRLAEVTSSRSRLEEEVASLEERLAAGDQSVQDVLAQRESALRDAHQELDSLRSQIARSEAEFKQYEVQVSDTATRQQEAIQELRLAVTQSRAERAQLEEKLASANAQFADAKADLELQRERYTQLQDELRVVRAASSADEAALYEKQDELDAERRRVDRLRAEVDRLTQQSQRYETQLSDLQQVAQAKKVDFAPPTIVMLEPDDATLVAAQALTRSTQQTRGISVIAATSASETRIIRGRIDAPGGLAELTIDGWQVPFDEHNAFTQTLKLDAQTKRIRIEAADHNGKRAVKEFEYRVSGADTVAKVYNKEERFEVARNTALDHLKYYALLIANEDYENDEFAPDLQTPVRDAEAIANVLRERYGFQVKILRNADKETLEKEFERIFYHEESDDDRSNDKDGVLIYYAGHGYLSDSRVDNAYFWAPVDAEPNSPRTWFETRQIERYMKNSATKQIMVVADSCFAGKVLSRDGEGMKPVSEESQMFNRMLPEYTERKRSRYVLTSGGKAPVLDGGGGDHSVFARAFLDMLQNNEGIISAHTMSERLAGKVMFLAEKQNFEQVPEFGHLRSAGHESGVFYLPAPQFPANMSAATNASL
jgi:predicted  nucleic acid-binding Zn-ribbon protein